MSERSGNETGQGRMTDEEFCELLMRDPRACDGESRSTSSEDSEEARTMRAALEAYRGEALQWAERRSATQPSLRGAAGSSRTNTLISQWALAAIALVTVAAGVVHVRDHRAFEPASISPRVGATGGLQRDASQQMAIDNALLSSIDRVVTDSALSNVEALDLKSATVGTQQQGSVE